MLVKSVVFRKLTNIKIEIISEQIRFTESQFDTVSEILLNNLNIFNFGDNFIENVKIKLTKLKYRAKIVKSPFELIGRE